MKESDRVLVEILVAAPIETVWRALRDPAEVRRWFGWDYPGLAEEINMIFGPENVASDADHTLRFGGMGMAEDRYTLEAQGDHTIVRLIRSAPVTDPSWKGIYDDVSEGWLTFTEQLRFVLERHHHQDRRTLYLNGRAKTVAAPLPAQALGLDSVIAVPTGHRYATKTTLGEAIEGQIWFRSPFQLGLTVDGYGDGLIIIGTRPTTDKSPHGGGNVVIMTYGLDDATFAGLRDRWIAWWGNQYEVIEVQ
jgi:uncharacterized protein YndB with AHSA1/START domain